jgi:hypothetical protein
VEGDRVKFSTKNRKSYTYDITKFSVTDRLTLRKWKPTEKNPVEEDSKLNPAKSEEGHTAFRSKHFEFDIIGDTTADQLAGFVPIFEAVHWAFSKLPVDLKPKPAESHFKVKLYTSYKDFEIASKESLTEEQPAIYNLDKDIFLAPIDRLKPSPLLTREIAYALLGERLATMPPWLAVAVTEYLAAAPYKDLALNQKDPLANTIAYLNKSYGLSAKTIPMVSPFTVMGLNYKTLRDSGLEGSKGRSSALLTFYYFAHLDRKGKGMDAYMLAIRTKTAPDEAAAALLNDRNQAKLEDEFKVAFVPKKLRIAFIQ